MSYNPDFFTDILDSLLDIYDALEGFSQYVFRFLSMKMVSTLEILGIPAPDWFPEITMLQILFGSSIAILFAGIVWKWLKEFIL